MSSVQRTLPAIFLNQQSYSIVDAPQQGKLPVISDNATFSLDEIINGNGAFPSRLCMLALLTNDEQPDLQRLLCGALLNASNTPLSAARVSGFKNNRIETGLKNWYKTLDEKKESTSDKQPGPSDPPKSTVSEDGSEFSLPEEFLPEWYNLLDVSRDELEAVFLASNIEVYAYIGVLAMAIAKQPTTANIEAFNGRRRQAVRNAMTSDTLYIFRDNSPFLTVEVLSKVHRTFNLVVQDRALLFTAIVDRNDPMISGEHRMFYTFFNLTAGASLNPLLLVTRFIRKYPDLFHQFPELHTEYFAAGAALAKFRQVPEARRMFLKLIFGNAYVPVPRGDIDELLGMSVFVLRQEESSLANYAGGTLSEAHQAKVSRLLSIQVTARNTVDPEEPAHKQ